MRSAVEVQKHVRLRNILRAIGGVAEQAGSSNEDAIARLMRSLPGTVKDWKSARETAAWGLAEGRKHSITLEDRPKPRGRKPNSPPVTMLEAPEPKWTRAVEPQPADKTVLPVFHPS